MNKKQYSVDPFAPASSGGKEIRLDKYTRSTTKDSEGHIQSGGYYDLKKIDFKNKRVTSIPGLDAITEIKERNKDYMRIGTANGLHSLEEAADKYRYIPMSVGSSYIYPLYQAPNGLLYIGMNNFGLLIYDPAKKDFQCYHKNNYALISNNIYTIFSDGKNDILLSIEYGSSSFYP